MNFSTILGFAIGIFLIYYSTTEGVSNPAIFLDTHAIVLVIGGTLATIFLCFSFNQSFGMVKVFFSTLTQKKSEKNLDTIREISDIAKKVYNGESLSDTLETIHNHFFKESLELLSQGTLSSEEFEDVLEKRFEQKSDQYRRLGGTFKIIGKFPPAFGLIGATVGMISLLQNLGKPDSFENLGPAMSTALVATFYGLIVANIFIIPIGENIMSSSDEELTNRRIVIEGTLLIRNKKHPILVKEYLKSYLEPVERNLLNESKNE